MIVLYLLAILILLCFFVGMMCLRKCCLRKAPPTLEQVFAKQERRWGRDVTELRRCAAWYQEQKTEPMDLLSFDGLQLHGRWLPAQGPSKGRILLFHGYRSLVLEDLAGLIPFYHSLGYDLLIPDQRAHGDSEGQFIGFGVLERKDCISWLRYLDSRFGPAPTFLAGVSMGATTVLMATGEELPGDVRGVIGDCGFTSPRDIIAHQTKAQFHLPAWPLVPLASLLSRLLAGYGFSDCSTLDTLARTQLPVLLIHGEADNFVPTEMSRQNYAACRSEKELLLIPDAGHGGAYLVGGETYRSAVTSFLNKHNPQA